MHLWSFLYERGHNPPKSFRLHSAVRHHIIESYRYVVQTLFVFSLAVLTILGEGGSPTKRLLCTTPFVLLGFLLFLTFSASALADSDENYEVITSAVVGNSIENYTVSITDDPYMLQVSGHVIGNTKAILITMGDGTSYFRVFVFPDLNGDFSVSFSTARSRPSLTSPFGPSPLR